VLCGPGYSPACAGRLERRPVAHGRRGVRLAPSYLVTRRRARSLTVCPPAVAVMRSV